MTRRPRVFMTGGWGYGNRGDNAILSGTLEGLRSLDRDLALTITSFSQSELQTKHRLSSKPSAHRLLTFRRPLSYLRWPGALLWSKTENPLFLPPALRRQLKEMKEADLIVFGGGGYFNDTWTDALPARLLELLMAKSSGTPYVILGQTIGPFSDENASETLPKVLDRISLAAYRDLQSAEVLKLAGLRPEQMKYTSDMAHLVGRPADESPPHATGKVRIGLMFQSFRQFESRSGVVPYGRYERIDEYRAALLDVVTGLSKALDAQFVMLASTSWDEKFIGTVVSELDSLGITTEIPEFESAPVDRFIEVCQSVDVMLSTNMHPAILASLNDIPSVALSYHFKYNDYMDRIGRSEYCHRIDDFDVESVVRQTALSADMDSRSRTKLSQKVEIVVVDARENIDLLRQFISPVGN